MKLRSIIIIGVAVAAIAATAFAWHRYQAGNRYVFIPKDVSVTLPEGTNIADMDGILAKTGIIQSGELIGMAADSAVAKNSYASYEGTLFPDTYRFDLDTPAGRVLEVLTDTFEKKAGNYRKELIVASLLEKEVRTDADMRIVAGIIERRMAIGMPLQIDATVAYGACYKQFVRGKYCDVSQANIVDNIRVDSAYNTYARRELPPAPITNPGLRALQAAAHPQASNYLYYLSTPDGTTIFSKTLEEHNRAKAKYLR